MTRHPIRRRALGALIFFIVPGIQAEERCASTDTPRQCIGRLISARAYAAAAAAAETANTGTPTVTGPIRSAVKDFLSAASAHLAGTTVKDSGKAFTVDYNLPDALLGAGRQVNLQAVVTDPVLSDAVTSELAGDPAKLAAAKRSLGPGDDVSVSASFNLVTKTFGRGVEPHRALLDSMLAAFTTTVSPPAIAEIPPGRFDTPFAELIADPAARMTAMTAFEAAAITGMPAALQQLETDFALLANDQPQLFISAIEHRRAPRVGPDEREYRLTWEIGTHNVNSFRRAEGRDCEARDTCLTAFNDYVARRTRKHHRGRLALAIGYRATAQGDPGLTTPPVAEMKAHAFTYTATYGQDFMTLWTGKPTHVDITFAYDGKVGTHSITQTTTGLRVAEAVPPLLQQLPPPRNRSIAATVTPALREGLYAPMSIVYRQTTGWVPGAPLPPGDIPISPFPPSGYAPPSRTHASRFDVYAGFLYRMPSSRPPSSPDGKKCCCCAP